MGLTPLRLAVRSLNRQRGFSAVVILSLGLAISVNTTMYSVLDALIHPRLDLREPSQLYTVRLYGDYRRRVTADERDAAVRSAVKSIERVAWFSPIGDGGVIEHGSTYAEGHSISVGPDYFDLLGPRVLFGRTFIPSDAGAETSPIVLGEPLWHTLFPSGENPLGARITVGQHEYVVIGVISQYSEFPSDFVADRAAMWTLMPKPQAAMYARLIRLRHGASRADAERELGEVAARIAVAAGEPTRDVAFRFHRATDAQFHLSNFHYALMAAVAAVLLVACANVANMQLARGIGRSRELAVRVALGATRRRLVEHLLLEAAILAFVGLAAGLVLEYWGAQALRASIPPSIGRYVVEPQMSWRVLAFAVAATLTCILLVGVVPAIRVSGVDPNSLLKAGSGTGATRTHRRQYGLLVAVELALTLGLLSGAAVTISGAKRAATAWDGFDPAPLSTGIMVAGRARDASRPLSEMLNDVERSVESVAGVAIAAAVQSGAFDHQAFMTGDRPEEIEVPGYSYSIVTPSYVRTMGLPIVAGRDFREGERDEPAVIIDRYTARRWWPNASPVGALIKFGDRRSAAPFVRIVGVVGRARDPRDPNAPENWDDVDGSTIGRILYLPGRRDSVQPGFGDQWAAQIIARASGDPASVPIALRRAGVFRAQSMDEMLGLSREKASRSFVGKIFGLFAALGLGLAAIGVYGTVAHSVAERRRELGVRIALGASRRDILRAVLRESVTLALAGVAVGLLGTKYGVLLLRPVAYGADLFNAPMFAVMALVLLAIAGASALVPAYRATKLDPTESLRSE